VQLRKVAAVTGSRRGIGKAVAEALASQGYDVVLSGVSAMEDSTELLNEFSEKGYQPSYIRCDVSISEHRQQFFNFIRENYGRLDLFVNNAGIAPTVRMDLMETTESSFSHVLDINLKGAFFMCQAAAKLMIETQRAIALDYKPRIVNITSISSFTASVNRGEYCISKAGSSMVTKLFATRLAEYGIPVFEIQPGIIQTDMIAAVADKYKALIKDGLTPINRIGSPEDIASAVIALASGNLDFATGQVINADGGFHLRRL